MAAVTQTKRMGAAFSVAFTVKLRGSIVKSYQSYHMLNNNKALNSTSALPLLHLYVSFLEFGPAIWRSWT